VNKTIVNKHTVNIEERKRVHLVHLAMAVCEELSGKTQMQYLHRAHRYGMLSRETACGHKTHFKVTSR